MNFRVRFLFKNSSVNNEIDISIWKFLPGATKIGTFFRSGDIWFETNKDWSIDELSHEIQKAIDDVFAYYKKEEMFGYLAAGLQQWLDKCELFKLSAFDPPEEAVRRIKELVEEIKQTEEKLFDMRIECGDLFRKIE